MLTKKILSVRFWNTDEKEKKTTTTLVIAKPFALHTSPIRFFKNRNEKRKKLEKDYFFTKLEISELLTSKVNQTGLLGKY